MSFSTFMLSTNRKYFKNLKIYFCFHFKVSQKNNVNFATIFKNIFPICLMESE